MSSDDDDALLQRRKGKSGPELARVRPAVAAPEPRLAAQARQSKEAVPQKLLQRTVSQAQQGKQQLFKSSSNAASAEHDSDDDAELLKKHQLKLQQQIRV